MKLYDEIITNWGTRLAECPVKSLAVTEKAHWEDAGNSNLILRSDMAYELGGERIFTSGTWWHSGYG